MKKLYVVVVAMLVLTATIVLIRVDVESANAAIDIDPIGAVVAYSFNLDISDVDYDRYYVIATFDGRLPLKSDYDKKYIHSEKISRLAVNGKAYIRVAIVSNDRWTDRPVEVYYQDLNLGNVSFSEVKMSGNYNEVIDIDKYITKSTSYSYKIGCKVLPPYDTYGTFVINAGIQDNDQFLEANVLQVSHLFIGCLNPLSATDTKALKTSRIYTSNGYIYGVPHKPINLSCIWIYIGRYNTLRSQYRYPDWDVDVRVQYIVNGAPDSYVDSVLKKPDEFGERDPSVLYGFCIAQEDVLEYIESGYYMQSIEFSIMKTSHLPVPVDNVNTQCATEVLISVVLGQGLHTYEVDDFQNSLAYLQNTVNGTLRMLNVPIYENITLLNIFATILIFGMVVFIFRITGVT